MEKSVTIVVKEGFRVSLDKLKDGFVGDEVSCEATVTPEKYADRLQITVGDQSCTGGSVRLEEAGELTARAWVTVDNRTEANEAIVVAKAAVAGKVYPLTDQGVAGQKAGFTVTLEAGDDVIDTGTTSDGSFAIKSDRVSDLGSQQVTLSVSGRSGEFYGSKAVLPASELLALVEDQNLGFILAPKSWNIRSGKLSGNSADLKLRAAFTRVIPDDSGSSFYKLVKVFGDYIYVSTLSKYRPYRTAFDHTESSAGIAKSDSVSFWDKTTELEAYVGHGDLFSSATLAEVPTTDDGIHVLDHDSNGSVERTSIGSDRHINGGQIELEVDGFGESIQIHEQGPVAPTRMPTTTTLMRT